MDGDWYRMSNKWDGVIYSITLHSKNSKTGSTKVKRHDLIKNSHLSEVLAVSGKDC